jgi:hypothetical protein
MSYMAIHHCLNDVCQQGTKASIEPSNMENLKFWVKTKLHVEIQFNRLRIHAAVAAGKPGFEQIVFQNIATVT